ncbi:MAG: hypothetical protein Q7R83_03545 [bacterium]|nr:hypothetical protein [bacterium]
MGQKAAYKCNICDHAFEANSGGGFQFVEYRCVNCDAVKQIESNQRVSLDDYQPPTKEAVGTCDQCGGDLSDKLGPMCPQCKSRDVKMERVLAYYD